MKVCRYIACLSVGIVMGSIAMDTQTGGKLAGKEAVAALVSAGKVAESAPWRPGHRRHPSCYETFIKPETDAVREQFLGEGQEHPKKADAQDEPESKLDEAKDELPVVVFGIPMSKPIPIPMPSRGR